MNPEQKRAIADRVSAVCKELEAIRGEIPYGVVYENGEPVGWSDKYEREIDILTSSRFALMNVVVEFSGE